ncbi:MFS transporter [Planococcus sp. N028]|uniref:MFS transporter n=1 Tax=Planococcus shixiaomingii TaxID=3058393 RepID=A0ABT8MYW3_9BACL|nr:MFS transporter [Planococcus sp. N028]MDN7240619.1 MFS transporter [Planococcus sp. N028]
MKRIHYSWVILSVVFFSIITAGIIRSSSGVFIVPFETDFGWERSTISFAFAISLFLYGISGPFLAALIERIGLKKMMVLATLTLLIGILLTFFMTEAWHLLLIWGIIIGVGSGLFLTVLSPYVANQWFVKRRGLALGILTASTATGQLILLPLLAIIVEDYSWRWAMGLILILSLLTLLLILVFMKNSPQEIGGLPYGQEKGPVATKVEQKGNPITVAFQILFEVAKVKAFWLLAASFFICGLSTSGLIGTHFISYCMGFGFTAVAAASMLSLMGVFDLIGTTFSGWLSDRFDNRWLLFWYYCLRGISLVFLPFALADGSYIFLVIFSVFYGLDWIATVPPTINIARQTFGIEKSVVVYGWIFAAHQLGAAVAASGAGLIYNVFNSYSWAFALAGMFCLLAGLFVIVLKKQPIIDVEADSYLPHRVNLEKN